MDQQITSPLVIQGNKFINNSALIESNVLNLRKRNSVNLLGVTYLDSSNLTCGGIEISENTFSGNVGCPSTTNAVANVYCYDSSHTSDSSIVSYVSSYDSQQFIGDSGDLRLLNVNTDSFTYSYYNYSYLATGSNQTLNYSTNLYILNMKSNVFTNNFPGQNSSLINVQGFPIINLQNEIYQGNLNYLPNAFIDYSPLYALQSNKSSPTRLNLSSQSDIDGNPIKS